MEPNKGDELGEMYLPDNQGEYMPKPGMVQTPSEEYALLLEVMMTDCPEHPCLPTFWNAGMVMDVLKGDPALRDLEHVQVDSPGMAHLFFFDKQGDRGLKYDAAQALRTHVVEVFSKWISCSALSIIIPLPLALGSGCFRKVPTKIQG